MANNNQLGFINTARTLEKVLGPIAAVVLILPVFIWAGLKSLVSVPDGLRYLKIRRM
jgi:hypothetical protein